MNQIQEMISSLMHDDTDILFFSKDKELVDVGKKINDLKQRYLEDTLIYKQAQERFFHILQNIKSTVILIDKNANILFINKAGEELFQLSRMDIIGKTHWKIGRDSGLSEKIEQVRKSGHFITTYIKQNYPYPRLLEATISQTNNSGNGLQELVILLTDVTERERMDQMRKDFVANVSHELRTPLTSIKGFTETLLDGAMKDQAVSERFLTIIAQETDRLQEMVNSLLDLSVIESQGIKPTLVNLDELVQQAVEQMELIAKKKEIFIHYTVQGTDHLILGDENRLKQVLINLLSNSIHYSNENKNIYILLEKEKQRSRVTVKDEGIGIPKEHLERIFERFYRVDSSRNQKSGGRGLGLSIVKQIIKQHDAQINIKSTVHVGTTISILFKAFSTSNKGG